MSILIDNCEESGFSLEALLRDCFYLDNSGNVYLGIKSTTSYDAETERILATFTGTYTDEQKEGIDTLVIGLKSLFGITTLSEQFDAFYMLAAANTHDANLNWVEADHNLTAGNAPTFTAFEGYTGNGANAYLATDYIPSTDTVNYTLTNCSFGVYSRTNAADDRDWETPKEQLVNV